MERSEDGPSESAGLVLPRTTNPTTNNTNSMLLRPLWPTIDGSLGLSEEDSIGYARNFFVFGFSLLPWLWAVNCFYFWPVLRHSLSFPQIRRYVVGSAIGFAVFTALLSSWALTFAIGGEQLFGPVWDKLVMYNVADKIGLTEFAYLGNGCLEERQLKKRRYTELQDDLRKAFTEDKEELNKSNNLSASSSSTSNRVMRPNSNKLTFKT